jgi:hypothetical protein
MKRTNFNQAEVLLLKFCKRDQDRIWVKFIEVSSSLGFKVRTTGGNYITHEIDCSYDDFKVILELTKEVF